MRAASPRPAARVSCKRGYVERLYGRPRIRPIGGRRGPLYLSDFREVVERAAYKPSIWRYRHRVKLKRRIGVMDQYWVGVCVGSADKSGKLDRWDLRAKDPYTGLVGNIKYGMIPEFSVFERHPIDGPTLLYRGWRETLMSWMNRRWIAPTKEIEDLLGLGEFRNFSPRRARA